MPTASGPQGAQTGSSGSAKTKRSKKRPTGKLIVLLVFLGIVVVGTVASLAVDSGGGSEKGSDVSPSTTTVAPPTTTTVPGIGDVVADGKFAFRVESVESPGRTYSGAGSSLTDEANGKWFIVHLSIKNIGSESQTFFSGNQRIIWNGAELEASDFTWNGTSIEELNPGVAILAVVMFDVAPSSFDNWRGAVLELRDSLFSGGARVHL